MPARAPLALALALAAAVAAVSASVALAAGNYSGHARDIALTAAQAKYKALTSSGAAPKPAAGNRKGYLSGWQTSYLKGTASKPVQAFEIVYVYKTQADARRAFANSCKACSGTVKVEQLLMKYHSTTGKTPTVTDIATCRNLYVAAVVSGDLKPTALANAAGALAGLVFAKAAASGMSPCVNR
jgi:hypothetical protein